MAKTKLNQTVVIALTLSFGAIPAFADNIFGTNQQYVPGNVGTNISDDTPPDPNEVKKQQGAESPSTPDSLGTTQAAPAGSSAAGGSSGAVVPGVNSKAPGATDFTVDEKRMQKKYKASLGHYKELIAKGEDMMQKSPDPNSETYKKGKILKEIGEKHLADAQTNNPFALTNLDPDGKDGTTGPKPKEKLTDKVGNFFHKEFENFKGPDAQKPPTQTAQTRDNSSSDDEPTTSQPEQQSEGRGGRVLSFFHKSPNHSAAAQSTTQSTAGQSTTAADGSTTATDSSATQATPAAQTAASQTQSSQ